METMKDGGSINKPPVLDDTDYDYWKVMVVDFLKSLRRKGWKVMLKGWKHPIITIEDGITSMKSKANWTDVKMRKLLKTPRL